MNSIERVKKTLHFKKPDKVPILKGIRGDIVFGFGLPSKSWKPGWVNSEEGLFPHTDTRIWKWDEPPWVKGNPDYNNGKWVKLFPREEIDEWGRIWNMSIKGDIGHPGRATLPDWKDLDAYLEKNTPNIDDKSRYEFSRQIIKSYGEEKYRLFTLGLGPIDIAAGIRGFARYLIDHKRFPKKVIKLSAHLADFFVNYMKITIKHGIDPHGFILFDDLGEQHGPFFGRKIFEKFYEGVYGRIIEEAHKLGCDVFLHCCGKVDPLLPSFIDWGLDAIEFDSPRMNGYPDLSPYRGKISMWGCLNIQTIYPFASPEECEREVWHMVRNLGTKDGGFGAYYYPQYDVIRVPHENIKAFDTGLDKYGIYSKIPRSWWKNQTDIKWKDEKERDIVPPLPI
jgi:uroporphyrinogen decarboxylase